MLRMLYFFVVLLFAQNIATNTHTHRRHTVDTQLTQSDPYKVVNEY